MDILTKYHVYNGMLLCPGRPSSDLHPYNKNRQGRKVQLDNIYRKYILQNLFSAITDFIKVE